MGPLLGRCASDAARNDIPANTIRSHHDGGGRIFCARHDEPCWHHCGGHGWRYAGQLIWYWVAVKFGEKRMHVFIDRYSRWLTLDWDEVERGQRLFRTHGSIIVLIARMLPTLRSLISIPAGLFGMTFAAS